MNKNADIKGDASAVFEELTSTGEGTGLEAERLETSRHSRFDPEQIDVVTQAYTVDLLLSRLDENALNLSAEFQRRANLWTDRKQSQLIESMLLKIPLPSLYVSEDGDGVFSVVVGIQRLCAISRFVNPQLLSEKLKIDISPLRLEGLESLEEYENKSFADLPKPLQRRIRETQLTIHVIRAGTPSSVKFNIFARINQGGLPLTAQEIRNVLYPGPARDWLRKMAEHGAFLEASENEVKAERMGDVELVLRFVALSMVSAGEGRTDSLNLDDFLNDAMAQANTWDDDRWMTVFASFDKSMKAAKAIFGHFAFRKVWSKTDPRNPINRGLFEAEAVALARLSEEQIAELALRKDQVIERLIGSLNTDESFSSALLHGTGSAQASNTRLKTMEQIFQGVLDA